MFIHQGDLAFGEKLCDELASKEADGHKWHAFEFASAWVNQAGARIIETAATEFLSAGGQIRATVGLDFSSTSYEGLGILLALESEGANVSTHVFLDENPACTFHPKVFLFRNAEQALLLVGSNNLTGAGLETNIEASLGINAALSDETIQRALRTLKEWREDADKRALRLTIELLAQLLANGYVQTEEEIRRRRNTDNKRQTSRKNKSLFGRSSTQKHRTKKPPKDPWQLRPPSRIMRGNTLLMRVRPRRSGTQLQISMRIHSSAFMNNAAHVISGHNGSRKPIGYDHVQRKSGQGQIKKVPNLARFEAPELANMSNPIARFRWVSIDGERVLQYELFDADTSSEGAKLFNQLEQGIAEPPATNLAKLDSAAGTLLSKANRQIAQWYRLV